MVVMVGDKQGENVLTCFITILHMECEGATIFVLSSLVTRITSFHILNYRKDKRRVEAGK